MIFYHRVGKKARTFGANVKKRPAVNGRHKNIGPGKTEETTCLTERPVFRSFENDKFSMTAKRIKFTICS